MNDIEKTNADECLDELFEEKQECKCGDDYTCHEDCNCSSDDKCSENCTCNDECGCKTGGECTCGENCECGPDCTCHKECDCNDECSCGDDCHCTSEDKCSENCTCGQENLDEQASETDGECNCNQEKCKCGCGENLEENKQPSDTAFEALLRLQAEFDNYRKRTEKEKSEIYHHGFVDAVTDFLPALDSFKMAKEYITDKSTLVGIEYIEKGILQTLEKMGVTAIDATGKFDPNFHTAIDTSSDENYEEGDIVKECYKGFKMGDKVIRFSQVIVKR